MLGVLLVSALGAPPPPASGQVPYFLDDCLRTGGRCQSQRNGRPSGDLAFFEFAPASGAGMGSACACAAVTGAKGAAVTFTRTGNATCSRQGLATTGIANGDLVSCGGNLPRVESSGGVLGLRVESARTNSVLRSEEIDNAAWIPQSGGGASLPVITANAAVAPDGTTTAERVVIGSCSVATQFSLVQSSGSVQTSAAGSLYVRGNGASGNLGVVLFGVGGISSFISCSYVSGSWSRCQWAGSGAAATVSIYFGCGNGVVGMTDTGSADVFVWGAQIEAGAYATSYIPTVASAVTRNAESAFASLPASQVGSMAATVQVPYPSSAAVGTNRRLLRVDANGSDADRLELFWSASANVQTFVSVGGVIGATPFSALQTVPGTHRAVAWRTPGVTTANITNGVQVTAADSQAAFPAFNRVYLGVYAPSAGFELDGIITRVCVDPDPTRCR